MHTRRILLSALLPLLAFSCTRMAPESVKEGRQTVISARIVTADVQSKTWVDSKVSAQILPLYWSDGDRVNVNGQVSSPVHVAKGEKKSETEFPLRSVELPYKVVYPSSIIAEGASYDKVGDIFVTLPAVQAYCDSSFASGSAVMCGYSATDETPVALNNMCAAIRVELVNDSADPLSISGAKIISRKGGISGNFTLNPQNGTLLAWEDAGLAVELEMASAVTVGSEGTWFWFAVPGGTYPEGFDIFFTRDSDRRVMQCEWTSTKNLSAGIIYTFKNVKFVPGAKDIETADDWNEFAVACNAGEDISKYLYKDGVVRIGKDISAENLTKISRFTYKFDGQGKKVTRTAALNSLFGSIEGDVRNLTLTGEWAGTDGEAASLADSLNAGGTISECVNEMEIKISAKTDRQIIGGIVRVLKNGTIVNCINRGELTASPNCSSKNVEMNLGGIVAQVPADAENVKISGCSNTAALTVDPTGTGNSYGILNNAVGGIVAWMQNTSPAQIENCANSGAIEYKDDNISSQSSSIKAYATGVGGIIGIAAPLSSNMYCLPTDGSGISVNVKGCRNSATIHNCAVNYSYGAHSNNKVCAGGIAGAFMGSNSSRSTITDSKNTGKILPYDIAGGSFRAGFCSVASGFVGLGGNADFIRDTVYCSIGNGIRPSASIGGLIAFTLKPFKLSSSLIHYDGYWTRLDGYKYNRAAVAVVPVIYDKSEMNLVPDIKGSIVENCIIWARPYSSSTTIPNSSFKNTDDQSPNLKSQLNLNSDENAVCGNGYKTLADDVTFTNVVYNK